MKDNSRVIDKILTSDSTIIPKNIFRGKSIAVGAKESLRLDKVLNSGDRDLKYMKFVMLFNGIDSPWDIHPGTALSLLDPTSLEREIESFGDDEFKI